MNKQEEIKSLTWKYFREQKKQEIHYALGFIQYLILLLLEVSAILSLAFFLFWFFATTIDEYIKSFIEAHPAWSIITILVLMGGATIYAWLDANWTKAKRRAKAKLK